jgi:hypothetical protein
LSPNQSFSTTLCPSAWPADAVKSLKAGFRCRTPWWRRRTPAGALPRFSPVQPDRRRSGVTEKYSQARGSGGARNRPAPPDRCGHPPKCCPCRLPRHIRRCPRVPGSPPPSVQAAEAAPTADTIVSFRFIMSVALAVPQLFWPLSAPCPSGPVTSLSLSENILR